MKTKMAAITVALVAAALVAMPATAANATTKKAGGGLWDYGVSGGQVYSKYHHDSKYHSATACNGGLFNDCVKAVAEKGKWANAHETANIGGGNTTFWDTY